MDKALLFPSPRVILHNLFLAILPTGGAVVLFIQQRPVGGILLLALALLFMRDLGFVIVQAGRLTSYRLLRLPKRAEAPAALACEVDMIKRQILFIGLPLRFLLWRLPLRWLRDFGTADYWYPVVVLDSGKSIRLPIATKSRDKAVHTAALLRKALEVPIGGQEFLLPGRLARSLSSSAGPAPEREFGSEEWFKDQWS